MPKRVASEIDLDYLRSVDWWTRVDQPEGAECWLWKQSVGSHGYGQTWDSVSVRLAHRAAWELTFGRIPEGLTIDHACRVRICCNPSHLRLMGNPENGRDNGHARKTHCPAGHPYDGVNTYRNPKGHRICRQCRRDRRHR